MAEQKPKGGLPSIVESMLAPDVFADWAQYFSLRGNVVRITLVKSRINVATEEESLVVIGNLDMPVSGAQGLSVGLYNFLKNSGLDPNPPPADPSKAH